MTTKALSWVSGTLFVGACVLIGCQVLTMRRRLNSLEDGWTAHEVRKAQREWLVDKGPPVLAFILAAAAAIGWLR